MRKPLTNKPPASVGSGAHQRGACEFKESKRKTSGCERSPQMKIDFQQTDKQKKLQTALNGTAREEIISRCGLRIWTFLWQSLF